MQVVVAGEVYDCEQFLIPNECFQVVVDKSRGSNGESGNTTATTTSSPSTDSNSTSSQQEVNPSDSDTKESTEVKKVSVVSTDNLENMTDIALCVTDRTMTGARPVPIMTKEAYNKLLLGKSSAQDLANNKQPFPSAMYTGMGAVGDEGGWLKQTLPSDVYDSVFKWSEPFLDKMSNYFGEQYTGWLDVEKKAVVDNMQVIRLIPHKINGKNYLSRDGDSGAGILMQDPDDNKWKLVSVVSKNDAHEELVPAMINRTGATDGARAFDQQLEQWLKNHTLDGSANLTDAYNPFDDGYFVEPPFRVPDNYTSSTTEQKVPKLMVPKGAFPTNDTELVIHNNLNEPVWVNLNGSLFNNTVLFQGEILQEATVRRKMPAGYVPSNIEVTNLENRTNYIRKTFTIDQNATLYGVNLKGNISTLSLTTYARNGTTENPLAIETTNNTQTGNRTMPLHRTTPFQIHPRAPVAKTAPGFISAAVAGAAFASGMLLIAACTKCCRKSKEVRTKQEVRLLKDVELRARRMDMPGDNPNLADWVESKVSEGYTGVTMRGDTLYMVRGKTDGINLNKSFPNKDKTKGYAETAFCYAMILACGADEPPSGAEGGAEESIEISLPYPGFPSAGDFVNGAFPGRWPSEESVDQSQLWGEEASLLGDDSASLSGTLGAGFIEDSYIGAELPEGGYDVDDEDGGDPFEGFQMPMFADDPLTQFMHRD